MTSKPLMLWSKSVRDRDGHKCRECGTQSGLHAHHIKAKSKFPALAFEISNGVTLCRDCHAAAHAGDFAAIILAFPSGRRRRSGPRQEQIVEACTGPMPADRFNEWLKAMKISGAQAARLLGVNVNTITRYKKEGAPQTVGLACKALYHRLGEWK